MTTAVHLWRFYFRFAPSDVCRLSEPSRMNWEACDRAICKFTPEQVELLKQYYLTGYGGYEDMQAVKDFAEQNGMKQSDAWDVVKRANYEVIVERGLMDRKSADQVDHGWTNRDNTIRERKEVSDNAKPD